MLLLDNKNKKIQIKLNGNVTSSQLQIISSYEDVLMGMPNTIMEGVESDLATNNTTAVTAVDCPQINTARKIKYLSVYNSDTAAQKVIVNYVNSGSARVVTAVDLQVGYTLCYESGKGWYTIDTNGATVNIEISLAGISIGETVVGATNNKILFVDGSKTLQQITLGTNLSLTGSTLNAANSSQTLSQTLGFGNVTGGHDIVTTDGDVIKSADGLMQIKLVSGAYVQITTDGNAGSQASLFMTPTYAQLQYAGNGFYVDSGVAEMTGGTHALVVSSAGFNFNSVTASRVAMFDASNNLIAADTATYPTLAEFSYVKSVTSPIQAQINLKAPIASPTFTGTVILGQDAVSGLQAVTYQQLNVAINGADKEAVKYATTGPLPAVVYNNAAGTLTGVAFGAISTDGGAPAVGEDILVKDQVSSFQNGWYRTTTTGSGIAVFVLTRRPDSNVSAEFKLGTATFVTNGSTLGKTTWAYSGIDNPTLGTDAITFVQTAGQGSFIAGNGITITGTTIAIDTAVTVDKTTAQTLTNKTLTSPILTTPTLGVATGTSYNGLTITTTTGTLTISNSKTLTWQNNITVSGTDGEALVLTKGLTITTNAGTIAFGAASKTLTVNNSITVDGTSGESLVLTKGLTVTTNAGTVAFSAASKTLTINQNLTLDGATGKTITLTDSVTHNTNTMTFAGGTVMTVAANKNLTFADAFITSGAYSITFTATNTTALTLPTSGTLAVLTDCINQPITGYVSGNGVPAGTDSILQVIQKLNGNFITAESGYMLLNTTSGSLQSGITANTFYPNGTSNTNTSGTAIASTPQIIYISSADYPSVNGLTPKLRIAANAFTNAVAPFTGTLTFGLYPFTAPGSAGGNNLRSHTIGTVVSGSNGAVWTNPPANTNGKSGVTSGFTACADFALPADGWYAICIVTNATIAANSFLEVKADLQLHYV